MPHPIIIIKETTWQEELKNVVTSTAELLDMLGINQSLVTLPPAHFPLRVPRSFIQRMTPGDPECPLLLQVLARPDEYTLSEKTTQDPLGELNRTKVPGLIDKFRNRILLTLTGACAIHCRYCFRQYYPYEENTLSPQRWQGALNYIKEHPQISEVILSGGDPLSFKNTLLKNLLDELSSISHIKMIRLHTRFPIAIPSRLDEGLFDIIKNQRLPITMVLHVNHPNEIDLSLKKRLKWFKQSGITLLCQSVLLKGINDNLGTLVTLSQTLYEAGILPYYINLLDPVQGSQSFELSVDRARELYVGMLKSLPGFLVPRFVREIPGQLYKVPLSVS